MQLSNHTIKYFKTDCIYKYIYKLKWFNVFVQWYKENNIYKKNHSWTSDLEMHAWKRRFHLQRNHVQYQFCFLYKAMWSFLFFFFFIKLFSDIQLNSKLNWSTHFFFCTNFNTKAIALYLGLGFDQLPHRKLAAVPEWCPLI